MDEKSFLGYLGEFQIIISSAIAIGSAFFIVHGNRKTAAMTNATSILKEINQDERTTNGLKIISAWNTCNKDICIDCLAHVDCDKKFIDDRISVMHVLNQYEHLAVGINNKIYNEKIIKTSSYGTIVNLVRNAKPLIDKVRSLRHRPTIWQEIESLALKWEQDPLRLKKK